MGAMWIRYSEGAGLRGGFASGLALVLAIGVFSRGDEKQPRSSNKATTFDAILEEQTAKTFEMIKTYIQNNPQAPDADAAYAWLFTTARERGWEAEAVFEANDYLKRENPTASAKGLAASIRTVGWAKSGKWDEALLSFERQLADVRLRTPTPTVDLAQTLAVQAQIAGEVDTAREIYRNLSRTLFLNPTVKTLCDTKLEKLELVGEAAPEVSVRDLDGQRLDLKDLQGKWVLLDFWATNCPPCLEAFPQLKSLHKTYADREFTIIGISLDEEAETVRDFQKSQNLPWTLALSETDNGQTRERYSVPTIPSLFLINPQGKVELIDPTAADVGQLLQSRLKMARKPSS